MINPAKTWKSTKVIPYEFAPGHFDSTQQQKITQWLKDYEQNTCIRVQPRANERDYVSITRQSGCWSMVGKTGGRQELSLGSGCVYRSVVLHEFMHAAGFWHEQSRQDRDQYIRVARENVIPRMLHNFDKANPLKAKDIGNYDYQSIMQYFSTAFTSNGKKTMIRKDGSNKELGQPATGTFTKDDIYKLKTLYGCGATPTDGSTTQPPTSTQPPTTSKPCTNTYGDWYCSTFWYGCTNHWRKF